MPSQALLCQAPSRPLQAKPFQAHQGGFPQGYSRKSPFMHLQADPFQEPSGHYTSGPFRQSPLRPLQAEPLQAPPGRVNQGPCRCSPAMHHLELDFSRCLQAEPLQASPGRVPWALPEKAHPGPSRIIPSRVFWDVHLYVPKVLASMDPSRQRPSIPFHREPF